MVADLNLLGSVGDLYCFSNTLSMLVNLWPRLLFCYIIQTDRQKLDARNFITLT